MISYGMQIIFQQSTTQDEHAKILSFQNLVSHSLNLTFENNNLFVYEDIKCFNSIC